MTNRQKFLGLALSLVVIAVLVIGATGVLAQDSSATPDPTAPSTSPYGWAMRGMMQGHDDAMWTTVATALGIDVNTLITELHSGSTLAQLAEAHGVDVQTVYDAALTTMTNHMNAMVEAGYMTQAQVDERLTWMHDHLDEMPMWTNADWDACGMGGMMGGGMMHDGMMHDGMMRGGMMGAHHG